MAAKLFQSANCFLHQFERELSGRYFFPAARLGAIERRLKIMAASRPEAGKDGNSYSQTNVMVWLQSVLPSLERIVQQVDDGDAASAKQSLVLKSEAQNLD